MLFSDRHYIGAPSVDLDGDGIGQYADVDEIELVFPVDGEIITQLPITLSTNPVNPEILNRFWIQVATENDFSEINIVYENNEFSSNECTISTDSFLNGTQYYWRTKAFDGSKWSDSWSEVWSFTLNVDFSEVYLVSPLDGEIITDTTPIIDWSDVTGATGYHIQVNTNEIFTGTIINDDNTISGSLSEYPITTALSDNTIYYWHIKIKNEDGVWGDWSSTWSYSIDLEAPTLSSPSDISTLADTTPLLDWGNVTGATGYHIQVNTNDSFTGTVKADDDTLTFSPSEYPIAAALSDNTTYYWRARVMNEDSVWSGWSSTWSFGIDIAPPTTPSPSNGGIESDTTPRLNWEDVVGAGGYHIEVNTNSSFTGTVIPGSDTLTISEYTVATVLSDNTTYYWHVKINEYEGGLGDWCSAGDYTIGVQPV